MSNNPPSWREEPKLALDLERVLSDFHMAAERYMERIIIKRQDERNNEDGDVKVPFVPSWRERLWTAHPETRLNITELAEALGRPKSFVYRHTQAIAADARLPHRKLGGELVFVVEEIRDWIRRNEEHINHVRR